MILDRNKAYTEFCRYSSNPIRKMASNISPTLRRLHFLNPPLLKYCSTIIPYIFSISACLLLIPFIISSRIIVGSYENTLNNSVRECGRGQYQFIALKQRLVLRNTIGQNGSFFLNNLRVIYLFERQKNVLFVV